MRTRGWDYRVTRERYDGDDSVEYEYGIREVYYNDAGKVYMITDKIMAPYGENLNELIRDHRIMGEAFAQPVIDITDFENIYEVEDEDR